MTGFMGNWNQRTLLKQAFSSHPWIPFLGGLLLNCLVCLCLNLGGPFLGVTGPPVTLVADLISVLGDSGFMIVVKKCYTGTKGCRSLWAGLLRKKIERKNFNVENFSESLFKTFTYRNPSQIKGSQSGLQVKHKFN